ncbi:hypothetical protein C9374_006762 [Naegleria lovaniensis]|uniref:VLRF1 domain-containing protein n=1 Tax=Naegleria lovaniensis TaxID=51637 RepID=A0AA88KHK0_NAELO|nr:uncharacterized protein C9374_006762 [Naegleria lovaniensis]KAG2379645.1 hypothetical protein C9374_006762 [Naegleria lovaniensis]
MSSSTAASNIDDYPFGRYKINDETILNALIENTMATNSTTNHHPICVLEKNYNQIPGLIGVHLPNHSNERDHEENSKVMTFWNCWYNIDENSREMNEECIQSKDQHILHPFSSSNQVNDMTDNNQTSNSEIFSNLLFICIMHGGHFSGGIFDFESGKCLVHKTFSNYVSRKKQGGRQLSHDIQTGHRAKSAGSEIRRNQEKQFQEKLHTLLTQQWASYFVEEVPTLSKSVITNNHDSSLKLASTHHSKSVQKVFASMVYCPGTINRDMIEHLLWNELGVKHIPIRNIPFQVPKPNFMNLCATFEKLCSIHICSKKQVPQIDDLMEFTQNHSLRAFSENSSSTDEDDLSSDDDNDSSMSEEQDNTRPPICEKSKQQRLTEEYLRNYPSPLSPQSPQQLVFANDDHGDDTVQSPKSPLSPLFQFFGFETHSSRVVNSTHRSTNNKYQHSLNDGQPLLYSNMKKSSNKNHSSKTSSNSNNSRTIHSKKGRKQLVEISETEMRQQSLFIWGGIFVLAAATMAIYIWKFAPESSSMDDYY